MKAEEVAKILNISIEEVINDLDKGMWEILAELNRKNYFTIVCCEGHLDENGFWNGYIGFKEPYNFIEYPKNYDNSRKRRLFYWSGKGENSRKKFLTELYEWALYLPPREIKEIKNYILWGKNKKRPNGKWRILRSSDNYDDIRIELNRKQTNKYDLKYEEKIVGRY